jgi:hypothetical protein
MKQVSGKHIAKEIEECCRPDLAKIESAGIPRTVMLRYAVFVTQTRYNHLSKETMESFCRHAMAARKLAKGLDSLGNKAKACGFAEVSARLKSEAESLRQISDNLGQIRRKNGRIDHDPWIPILVDWILVDSQQFNCWRAVAHVIAAAYRSAGRDVDADHIDERTLRRIKSNLSKDLLSIRGGLHEAVKGEKPPCQQQQ